MSTDRIDWNAQPLGEVTDGEIARALGCTPQAAYCARRIRGIPALHPQAPKRDCDDLAAYFDGTRTDREIAELSGASMGQVSRARRNCGGATSRIDWNSAPLGSAPDIVLARQYGVDNKSVAAARWHRNIPAWREERACPCGERFIAFHYRQRYCGAKCQRYHWDLVHNHSEAPEIADCGLALRALRKTMKGRA